MFTIFTMGQARRGFSLEVLAENPVEAMSKLGQTTTEDKFLSFPYPGATIWVWDPKGTPSRVHILIEGPAPNLPEVREYVARCLSVEGAA